MNSRTATLAIVACLCGMAADAAGARALVVRSVGPSAKTYPPGKALPDTAKISLQSGDSITVVGGNSARTLRGPGTFPAAGGAQELAMASARRGRFGAMRSGDLTLNPSPWNLDVTQSGTICSTATGLKMWRPDSTDATKLTISKVAGGKTTVAWPAGKSTIDWPAAVPISDGAEYQLAMADGAEAQKVRFAIMPAVPAEAVDAAQALVDRGCQNQLDVLVEALADKQ